MVVVLSWRFANVVFIKFLLLKITFKSWFYLILFQKSLNIIIIYYKVKLLVKKKLKTYINLLINY